MKKREFPSKSYITKKVKSFVHHIALNYIEGEHLEKSEETKEIKLTDEVINKIAICTYNNETVSYTHLTLPTKRIV